MIETDFSTQTTDRTCPGCEHPTIKAGYCGDIECPKWGESFTHYHCTVASCSSECSKQGECRPSKLPDFEMPISIRRFRR